MAQPSSILFSRAPAPVPQETTGRNTVSDDFIRFQHGPNTEML